MRHLKVVLNVFAANPERLNVIERELVERHMLPAQTAAAFVLMVEAADIDQVVANASPPRPSHIGNSHPARAPIVQAVNESVVVPYTASLAAFDGNRRVSLAAVTH